VGVEKDLGLQVADHLQSVPPDQRIAVDATALRVAVLGKLGRSSDAKVHIEKLVGLKPDFASRASELIRRSLKVEGVIDELIDGLRRAGVEMEERRAFG